MPQPFAPNTSSNMFPGSSLHTHPAASGIAAPKPQQSATHRPSLHEITEAQKFAKYASSSLGFEDVPTALKYLQQAMNLLQGSKTH